MELVSVWHAYETGIHSRRRLCPDRSRRRRAASASARLARDRPRTGAVVGDECKIAAAHSHCRLAGAVGHRRLDHALRMTRLVHRTGRRFLMVSFRRSLFQNGASLNRNSVECTPIHGRDALYSPPSDVPLSPRTSVLRQARGDARLRALRCGRRARPDALIPLRVAYEMSCSAFQRAHLIRGLATFLVADGLRHRQGRPAAQTNKDQENY
jgi:hypothetical protein